MIPIKLTGLTTREAITDMIYRGVRAFDNGDVALLESSMTKDCVLDLDGWKFVGFESIKNDCFSFVSKLDTTHTVSGLRIDVKSDTEASLSATSQAQHYRPGEGNVPGAPYFMSSGTYTLDCVKDEAEGLWKAKHWEFKRVWSQGDQALVMGGGPEEA